MFYILFNSLKTYLLTQNRETINQMDMMLDYEEEDFYFPSLPSNSPSPSLSQLLSSSSQSSQLSTSSTSFVSSILPTEDTNEAIKSLMTMIQSPIICMRIESLKIFTEILSENNLSSDRKQIVEALYRLNFIHFFIEKFISLLNQNDSRYHQSDLFYEFHLLTLILLNIVNINVNINLNSFQVC